MSIYRLDTLFAPKSVVLAGASPQPHSVGHVVLNNLRRAGFPGRLSLVNPNYAEIDGLACHASVADLPDKTDLAIIATPLPTVPDLVRQFAERGTKGCVIITTGADGGPEGVARLREEVTQIARPFGMRIIGPDSIGVTVPRVKLDASIGAAPMEAGDLALVSQSGSVITTIVDWANRHNIGFSAVVATGDMADVDFSDLLDWFALDYKTRAILLYVEAIQDAAKFMSAARAAARSKPVVVIKPGLSHDSVRRSSHAGSLAGADAVYDAAFRRAGLLRVRDLGEMFDAAETLSRLKPFQGRRLAVASNGVGPAILALDRLVERGGVPATLAPATMERLGSVLSERASRSNPVDLGASGGGARYRGSLEALLADPGVDAVLMMSAPTALADAKEAASAVVGAVEQHRKTSYRPKPVLAAWLGQNGELHDIFEAAKIPLHVTPHDAVDGFMHVVRYSQAQEAAIETPPSLPEEFEPDVAAARAAVASGLAAGRRWLDPESVARVLEAYRIPCVAAEVAKTPAKARIAAERLLPASGGCVIKVLSEDLPHKSDVGGVRLGLTSADAVEDAAYGMLARVAKLRPDARIDGVVVQPMVNRPYGLELIAGITDDPVFGPVVVFGRGGTAVELFDDKALALPPLDMKLAFELMAETKVDKLLNGWRGQPPADRNAVALVLVKLSQLTADIPEIREIDLNPLIADERGVIVLDAKIAVEPCPKLRGYSNPRLAIRPYPKQWERHEVLRDGTRVLVRPVRPEDETLYPDFLKRVTPEDLRLRFFAPIKEFTHAFIAKLTQLDYARAVAFAAINEDTGELWGVVRLHADPNHETGEYAILLRSELKGRGLGWLLMQRIIDYAKSEGFKRVKGQVLRENTTMIAMCQKLGFEVHDDAEDTSLKIVTFEIDQAGAEAAE